MPGLGAGNVDQSWKRVLDRTKFPEDQGEKKGRDRGEGRDYQQMLPCPRLPEQLENHRAGAPDRGSCP